MGAGCQGLLGPDTQSGAALLSLCLFCQISPSSRAELSRNLLGSQCPRTGRSENMARL